MNTLIVTDLDGSLWDTQIVCHPSTTEAVEELGRREVPILVATGRREASARAGLESNGLSFPAVLLNGALGVDLNDGNRFHEAGFSPEHAIEVIELLASVGISACAYTADGRVRHDGTPTTSPTHQNNTFSDHARGLPDHHDVVVGFSMLGMAREVLAPAVDALSGSKLAETIFYEDGLYAGWSLMIQPAGVSKQTGIEAYLAHSGLGSARVIAVGDGSNDLEMLAAADIAVVCAGGHHQALALADVVVPDPDAGGWAQILDLL